MAVCNLDLKVDDDKLNDEDSLENVIAFSTFKGQHWTNSQEGLFLKDSNGKHQDRRVLVRFDKKEFCCDSYKHLGQVTVQTNVGKAVGSGHLIKLNGSLHILSCAHNFFGYSMKDGKKIKFKKPLFYRMRDGAKNWVSKCILDASYIRVPACHNGNPASGYDIAVCPIGENLGSGVANPYLMMEKFGPPRKDNIWGSFPVRAGLQIEIPGYPGEKGGKAYTHTGLVEEVSSTKVGRGRVIWYSLDTTPGNSGSPIFVTDKAFIKEAITSKRIPADSTDVSVFGAFVAMALRPPSNVGLINHLIKDTCKERTDYSDVAKVLVGVHTGSDPARGLNFGTLITPSIKYWIEHDWVELKDDTDDSCIIQ